MEVMGLMICLSQGGLRSLSASSYHIQCFYICRSETFALIRVIDGSIRRVGGIVLLLLQFVRRVICHPGSGSRFVSKYFLSS